MSCPTCQGTGLATYPTHSVYGGSIRTGCGDCEAGKTISELL